MDQSWIRVTSGGRHYRLRYEDLEAGGTKVQQTLDDIYQTHAELECMCNPEHPVPMHLRRRRVKIRPPSYAVITNPNFNYAHEENCPRYRPGGYATSTRDRHAQSSGERSTRPRSRASTEPLSEREDNEAPQTTKSGRDEFVPSPDKFNDAQREAATHKDGPCIVVAAAGSGKTAVSISRIKYLIENGVDPNRILGCTFTRKAKDEMKARLVQTVGQDGKKVTVGTMHSVARRMLLPELGDEWTVVPEPSWLIEQVLDEEGPYNRHGVGPLMNAADAVTSIYNAKADAKTPEQVNDPILSKVYAAYEALKTDRRQMDFEDMLLQCVRLFQTNDDFARRWRNRWDYVLVDEFQDTNRAQWLFLLELVKNTGNLFVVGDDKQSIYAFRGGRPALMGQFVRTFQNAKKILLTINYRSHDLIVDLGNRVIELNRGHQIEHKVVAHRAMPDDAVAQVLTIDDDIAEARIVAEEILKLLAKFPDQPLNEFAILYRTNIQSRVYEEALAEHGITYHIVGDVHFYESREVKLILDYLRTTQDTSDPTLWVPLLNRPNRFIASTIVKEVQLGGWEVMAQHPKCWSFLNTIEQLKDRPNPAEAIQWLIETYPGLIRKQDEDEPIKWIDSLISSASRYNTVPEFLRYVDWLIEGSKTPAQDAVQLLTIHKAKGLEYDTVFVVGLAEGLLPHKKSVSGEALREETRLAYVAITRAKNNLFLLAAKRYGGKELPLSRFVKVLAEG